MGYPHSIIIYASHLNRIGGIETFVVNFCKRMALHAAITFAYDTCDAKTRNAISAYAKCHKLGAKVLNADTLILATAWGKSPGRRIVAATQIQMIHADYVACITDWDFKYKKDPATTHHVAVSNHVARQFEIATPYKIDKVIYNLL